MKQYDKNSLIGFVLMAIILIVFNTFFFPEIPEEQAPTTAPTEEIVTEQKLSETTTTPTLPEINESIASEELKLTYGIFASSAIGEDGVETLENDKLKISVAKKGGRIVSVVLKEYQTHDSLELELFDADSSRFNLQFTTGHNINTADLYFKAEHYSNTLSMKLFADANHYIEYLYTITDDYLIDFDNRI